MSEPYEVTPLEPVSATNQARAASAARQFASFLEITLRKLSSLAFSVATVACLIGVATYATGFAAFDGTAAQAWAVIGALICLVPIAAGIATWVYVRITVHHIPSILADLTSLLGQSKQAFAIVIDHDSGQPVTTTARSLSKLNGTIQTAPGTYPALMAAVRAGMKVPWLVVITVLSALAVGAFGTLLFLVAVLA